MTLKINNSSSHNKIDFNTIAKELFLCTIWVGNIFINIKDMSPKLEVRT